MKHFPRTLRLLVRGALLLSVAAVAAASAAPAADTMKQRVLPCLACHGETGKELESGYVPRIHGKPAGYLFNQLVNFREGRRYNQAMAVMVGHLSNDYLLEMAQYFADAHVPYPDPVAPSADKALLARGYQLATEGDPEQRIPACRACHGERLTGVQPTTPGLTGLPHFYIMAQLGAWRAGTRKAAAPDCMHTIAGRMSTRDVQAVAAWLAAQPTPVDSGPAPAPIAEPPMECGSVPLPGR